MRHSGLHSCGDASSAHLATGSPSNSKINPRTTPPERRWFRDLSTDSTYDNPLVEGANCFQAFSFLLFWNQVRASTVSAVWLAARVQIEAAMDDKEQRLMGMHGYCTQDLVNLILCGHSVTNVFDGKKKLDEFTTLKGVPTRAPAGLLSLFEWCAAQARTSPKRNNATKTQDDCLMTSERNPSSTELVVVFLASFSVVACVR